MNVPDAPGSRHGTAATLGGHARTAAVEHALQALTALTSAVGGCADTRTVRDVARITGLPRQTVHRWKTDPPPGRKRLQAVRDAGCG